MDFTPSYGELIRAREAGITESSHVRSIPETGYNFKMSKQVSEMFNLNHEIKLCNPNPLAQYQPGAKPTVSTYVYGGMLVSGIHPTDPSQCRLINLFESEGIKLWGNNVNMQSMINFDLDNKANNRQLRIRSSKDEKNAASLFQEVTFSHQDAKKSLELTLVPMNLTQKMGIIMSSLNYQVRDNLRFGGDLKIQNTPGMTGAPQMSTAGTIGITYSQFDNKYNKREGDKSSGPLNFAETSAKLTLADNSFMPASLTLQHWVRSRVSNNIEALAQIDCNFPGSSSNNPMAAMMGMGGSTETSISGKIGACYKYPDPAKPQPYGMPARETGNFFKSFIDSDFKVQNIIETKFAGAASLTAGIRTIYDMKADQLKVGVGMSFGE